MARGISRTAVLALLAECKSVTHDLGGNLGTSEFADAVIAKMSCKA